MARTSPQAPRDIAPRLAALRAELAADGYDFFLVPSSDAHQSEYLPDAWQRRAWVTGFTGSAGNAVVGRDGAWLWADSRYWLQAERELDPAAVTLMRMGEHDVPSLARFLASVAANRVVAYDPFLHSPAEIKELSDALADTGARLVATSDNLVDRVWRDRPALPDAPVEPWPAQYSGRSTAEKLTALRTDMVRLGVEHVVVTTLDEIAWLYDLRGQDVDFNPVAVAWALVSLDGATLFIDPKKLGPDAHAHLAAANVRDLPYGAFGDALAALSGRVLVDRDNANQWVVQTLARAPAARTTLARSPVQLARAKKSSAEADGMRRAHTRDGVAVSRFLTWLDTHWRGMDEVTAADRLAAYRADNALFRGLSFDTICGYADHGAIVHYRAQPESAHALGDQAILLLDSGAQYLDGTTDITRTIHLGTPTAAEREHYTRVLKGHLALRHQRFPRGTTGTHLDGFARAPLWNVGLNYGHGTGHGVGCYLSVHQGPHRVSPGLNDVALEPGMVLSNEPGLYLAGHYGIRIENLCVVTEVLPRSEAHPYGPFYELDDLTLVPYCRKLIDPSLLSPTELAWIDGYHARVLDALLPGLAAFPDHDATRAWLLAEAAPLAGASA